MLNVLEENVNNTSHPENNFVGREELENWENRRRRNVPGAKSGTNKTKETFDRTMEYVECGIHYTADECHVCL